MLPVSSCCQRCSPSPACLAELPVDVWAEGVALSRQSLRFEYFLVTKIFSWSGEVGFIDFWRSKVCWYWENFKEANGRNLRHSIMEWFSYCPSHQRVWYYRWYSISMGRVWPSRWCFASGSDVEFRRFWLRFERTDMTAVFASRILGTIWSDAIYLRIMTTKNSTRMTIVNAGPIGVATKNIRR